MSTSKNDRFKSILPLRRPLHQLSSLSETDRISGGREAFILFELQLRPLRSLRPLIILRGRRPPASPAMLRLREPDPGADISESQTVPQGPITMCLRYLRLALRLFISHSALSVHIAFSLSL
ncbi:unnamed protein product [Gadus morhua 'NCC']